MDFLACSDFIDHNSGYQLTITCVETRPRRLTFFGKKMAYIQKITSPQNRASRTFRRTHLLRNQQNAFRIVCSLHYFDTIRLACFPNYEHQRWRRIYLGSRCRCRIDIPLGSMSTQCHSCSARRALLHGQELKRCSVP